MNTQNRGMSKWMISMIVLGVLFLVAGTGAGIFLALRPAETAPPAPTNSATQPPTASPSTEPLASPGTTPGVSRTPEGWVILPVTDDPEEFLTAMVEATGTFDATKSTYDEWVEYIQSLITLHPLIETQDSAEFILSTQRQNAADALPMKQEWDMLERQNGSMELELRKPLVVDVNPQYPDTWRGMAEISLILTYEGPDGKPISFTETAGTIVVNAYCAPKGVCTAMMIMELPVS